VHLGNLTFKVKLCALGSKPIHQQLIDQGANFFMLGSGSQL
jgi:hypothetical protein